MRLPCAVLLCCAALAAQPGSVAGTVIDDTTGGPLSGVHIALASAALVTDSRESYGAISDRAGHFSMAAVPAGTYMLTAERTGYLLAQRRDDPPLHSIRVAAGQKLELPVRLAARAVIAGRIIDDAGDPVPAVAVQASFRGDQMPGLVMGAPNSMSDDRGDFRVVVPPGKYYLRAVPNHAGSSDPVEVRTDGSTETTYSVTYYPGVESPDGAAPIVASAGRDVTGIEIRLVRHPSMTVGGTVNGPSGPAAGAMVWLVSKGGSSTLPAASDGRFRFNHIQPGSYMLYARSSGGPALQSQVVDLRLESENRTEIQLLLGRNGELSGTLEMGGEPAPGNRRVTLAPPEALVFQSQILGGTVDEHGAFRLTGILPGRYRPIVTGLPDDAYVDQVILDGGAAAEGILDFSGGLRAAEIKVKVARNGGRLSGTVHDPAGLPLAEGQAMVVLVADDSSVEPDGVPVVSSGGKFTFKGLRPGKYHIVAYDLLDFSTESLRKQAARGEEVVIPENGRVEKDVTLRLRENDARK